MDLTTFVAQAQTGGLRDVIDRLARTPQSHVVWFVVVLSLIRLAVHPALMKTPIHKRTGVFGFYKFLNELVDAFVYAGVFVFLIIRPFMLQTFLIPSGSMWPTLKVNEFIVANKAIYRYTDPKFQDIVVFRPPVTASLAPEQVEDGEMKLDFIKRCIGLPGDLIEMKSGQLYRNGQQVSEPYVHYSYSHDGADFEDLAPNEVAALPKANFKLIKWDGKVIPLDYTSFDANSPYPRMMGSMFSPPYSIAPDFRIVDPDEQKKAMAAPAEKIPPGFYLMMGDNRNNSYDGRAWGLVPREQIIGRSEFVWLPLGNIRKTR